MVRTNGAIIDALRIFAEREVMAEKSFPSSLANAEY